MTPFWVSTPRATPHLYWNDTATRAACGYRPADAIPAGSHPERRRSTRAPEAACVHCILSAERVLRRGVAA
jgi:hypothetical protein